MRDYKDVPKRDNNRIQPKPKPDFRFSKIRQMSDREAMARMMMAEDDKNFQGGQAVWHVIFNRSQNPNYVNMYGGNPTKNISPIISVLSGKGQFSPYSDSTTRFFADYKDNDLYNQYYDYAGQILGGEAEDFTGGADDNHDSAINVTPSLPGGMSITFFNTTWTITKTTNQSIPS